MPLKRKKVSTFIQRKVSLNKEMTSLLYFRSNFVTLALGNQPKAINWGDQKIHRLHHPTLTILSIPPLIPAGIRGIRPESRNSVEFQEFRRIPAGIDRNPTRIDIIPPQLGYILRFYSRHMFWIRGIQDIIQKVALNLLINQRHMTSQILIHCNYFSQIQRYSKLEYIMENYNYSQM